MAKMLKFEDMLFDTPECNDFRKLANGHWIAYSSMNDKNGQAIRAQGLSIRVALEELRKKLYEG